jgi:hypothetical protein
VDRSRFCITGMPRSRTAWLAALMYAHGTETLHEYPPFFHSLEELGAWLCAGTAESPHGYADGFSIIYHAPLLKRHFDGCPIVVIQRHPLEVRRSWEAWDGPISDDLFANVMRKVIGFCRETAQSPNVLMVAYTQLETYEVVNRLVIHCTGRPLKAWTWQLFHRLKIELHKAKCRAPVRAVSGGV